MDDSPAPRTLLPHRKDGCLSLDLLEQRNGQTILPARGGCCLAQLLRRLRSVLVFAAVIVFTGGGVGFAHTGTPEGRWVRLFGCTSAPTYLRMEVGADGHVDLSCRTNACRIRQKRSPRRASKPPCLSPASDGATQPAHRQLHDLIKSTTCSPEALPGWGDSQLNCTHFVLVRMPANLPTGRSRWTVVCPAKAARD